MSDLDTNSTTLDTQIDEFEDLDPIELGIMGEIPFTTRIAGRRDLVPQVIDAIRTVYDPEIPVNIFDLGLIYSVQVSAEGHVDVIMTLTTPGCPVAEDMPGMVSEVLVPLEGVSKVDVDITWDPPWTMDCMTEDARLALGMF